MKQTPLLPFLFWMFFICLGCSTPNNPPQTKISNTQFFDIGYLQDSFVPTDTSLILRFPDFELQFSRMIAYDTAGLLQRIQSDTVYVQTEIGESVLGSQCQIRLQAIDSFFIEQAYQTSLVVSSEGPHCDLTEWKHFTSEWETVKLDSSGYLLNIRNYSEKERSAFADVSVSEMKSAVLQHCGKEWYKLIQHNHRIREGNASVNINRVIIRVTFIHLGKVSYKYILFNEALGC